MAESATDPRRDIPATDALLNEPRLAAAALRIGRPVVKRVVQDVQDRARRGEVTPAAIVEECLAALPATASSFTAVLNATGVVLHTNLGRAPLSAAALAAIADAAGYVDVEFDLAAGARAPRGRSALAALLAAVPGAEDGLIVNNGAAALALVATGLAGGGREIVLSRGELVEIGDGFRIADLVASTGARLREVGSTNRTHRADYEAAVGPDTGFVLKVHPSNFTVDGFASSVPVSELAGLGVPVVVDIGSGLLRPHPRLPAEPDAASCLAAGADVVTASADKLLGGPQAGILLGRRDIVQALRRHPLARAVRVDKLTLAALEATLVGPPTPTRLALAEDAAPLRGRAEAVAAGLAARGLDAVVVACEGFVGGGGAPGVVLPGWAVRLPEGFARPLRLGRPAVVARLEHGYCLLDLRCVPAGEDAALRDAVVRAAAHSVGDAGADGDAGDPYRCS